MATKRPQTPIGPVLQALFARDDGSLTDGQLLQRYLTRSDQAAFAVLVRRHGPMVLGVCRRILGNFADAEDAFQAVFLVLARKAPALASRSTVGAWLHGVARHTALKARAAAVIRCAKEQATARPVMERQESRNDWLPRLDEELSRLPRKYRDVIIACDLECKTRQQSARQLGWPEGTVATRLTRARALLAKRLLHGAQIISAMAVTEGAIKVALPAELVHSTIQTAALVAAGNRTTEGVLSAAALTLAKGVMQTMFWNKVKIAGVLLLAAMVIASVGGRTVQMLAAQEKQTQQGGDKTGQAKADQDKDKQALEKLRQRLEENANLLVAHERDMAWLKAAQDSWEGRWKEYQAGRTTVDAVLPWSGNLLKAELKLRTKNSEIIEAHQHHLKRLKGVEDDAKAKFDAGRIAPTQYHPAVYYRIEAEIGLEAAKAAK